MKNKLLLLLMLFSCFYSIVFSQTKATGKEVMIQGFHWTTDASTTKWYEVVKNNSTALQTAGFDAIWLPPPSKSTGGMGYIPTVWYDLNNAQGTQTQLVSLITDLHSKNIKVIADIVINHRGGTLGWYDFSTPSWNTPTETWSICNNSNISASGQKGTGAPDYDPVAAGLKSAGTSGSFSAARDLDHTNALVRDGIKTWMNWLKNDIGFDGWRYDFVHGYDGKYIKEYNDATNPYFSVGEILEGNRDRIVKWIDYTKAGTATASSTAFDFATKSALQNAFNDNNLSYLKDGSGKASGLIGVWPANAVTMLDNHDTGPVPYGQDLWIFPGSQVLKGYAYILTHPGTPMVWWPHYFNWGNETKSGIDALIKIRKENQLSSTSTLNIVAASNNLYAAVIDDKVAMKLGSDNWTPSGAGWILKLSGTGFAIWDKLSSVDVPSVTIADAGGTYNTGTTVNVVLTANLNTSTIYYTTDGTEPTTASPSAVGSKNLAITTNTTLKAFVKNTLNVSSAVKTETYTFAVVPEFKVYFKKPSNWSSTIKIYYWGTTGNATAVVWPGAAMTQDCGDWYTFTFPSTVSASNIIFNDGTLKTPDLTATAGIKYYDSGWLSGEPDGRCPLAPDLTIAPAGGNFTTGTTVNVVLTANATTSTIYYTTDGTLPTTASASAVGSKSLAISSNTTLKAFVKNTTNVSSAVKTEVYNFSSAPDLTIAPAGGNFTTGTTVNVVLTANATTSTIYYTTDGTEPTTASASAVGTKSLAITATTTLKAFVKNTTNVSSAVKTEVYSFSSAPDLTIAPAGGNFTTGTTVNVVLTANATTSTIYYTTDGTEPTTASASAVGTKSLAITATTTLKAFVKNTTNVSSAVKTEVYSFSSAPDLTIAPAGGNFTTGTTVNVVLTANATTSTIYYTTDGTLPTTASASAVGSKSLAISSNTTLKAFVKNTTNVSSAVKTEVYSFSSAPDLTIAPAGGNFTTGTTVNVALTANATTSTIYYTTDGTEPTTASASAVGTKSLAITATTTLKAFVKNTTNVSSAVKTEVYSFSSAPDLTIAPAGGNFTTGTTVNVVLTANATTSTIYYTTDGTLPTTASASAVGSKSLAISSNTTLKAFVKNTTNVSSAVKTEVYSFSSAPDLTIAPAGGNFTTGTTVNVALTANATTSTIYYTTDGTLPTTASASALGSKSLAISSNTTLKAFVKNTANLSSAVKTEVYSFSSAPDLTIAPAGGNFTTGTTVNVVLTANTTTSTIYYTTDGTLPTTASASAVGSKSLAISSNTTLKAFVKNTANVSSAVKTEVYSFSELNAISVYFKPPASWTVIPKVHYWNAIPSGSIANSVWPGETMTIDLNGYYKYTIVGPTSVSLIFSNGLSGTGNQTIEFLNKADGFTYLWEESLGIIENELKNNEVLLYPNPVIHNLQINTVSPCIYYQIIGIQGSVLSQGIPNQNTIDVSNLKNGVYLLKVILENEKDYYKKFIKN